MLSTVLGTGASAENRGRETKCPHEAPVETRQANLSPHKYVKTERALEGEWRDGCLVFKQR